MKRSTRIILSALTSMLFVSVWLLVIDVENRTLESIGIGVIVFFSVILFTDWKSKSK